MRSRLQHFIRQLFHFGLRQALACIFPVALFLTLAATKVVHVPFLHRYDLILLVCILVQFLMVRYKWESIDELKVISLFHVIGLALELYKVHMGSWSYPEDGIPSFSASRYIAALCMPALQVTSARLGDASI